MTACWTIPSNTTGRSSPNYPASITPWMSSVALILELDTKSVLQWVWLEAIFSLDRSDKSQSLNQAPKSFIFYFFIFRSLSKVIYCSWKFFRYLKKYFNARFHLWMRTFKERDVSVIIFLNEFLAFESVSQLNMFFYVLLTSQTLSPKHFQVWNE